MGFGVFFGGFCLFMITFSRISWWFSRVGCLLFWGFMLSWVADLQTVFHWCLLRAWPSVGLWVYEMLMCWLFSQVLGPKAASIYQTQTANKRFSARVALFHPLFPKPTNHHRFSVATNGGISGPRQGCGTPRRTTGWAPCWAKHRPGHEPAKSWRSWRRRSLSWSCFFFEKFFYLLCVF